MSIELRGSCLCGEHSFTATGNLMGFYHCHCKRCRKMSGTGHASNILLRPATLKLDGDRNRIGLYKIPEAERFASRFCKNCGAPIPRVVRETQTVIIAAGTLDHEIDLKPQCRIFWESKASWSCEEDALPTFAEYPE